MEQFSWCSPTTTTPRAGSKWGGGAPALVRDDARSARRASGDRGRLGRSMVRGVVRESLMRYLAPVVLALLLGAGVFEAAIALECIWVGPEPGDNARFEGVVMAVADLALVAGIVISIVLAIRDRRNVAAALFPVAA